MIYGWLMQFWFLYWFGVCLLIVFGVFEYGFDVMDGLVDV